MADFPTGRLLPGGVESISPSNKAARDKFWDLMDKPGFRENWESPVRPIGVPVHAKGGKVKAGSKTVPGYCKGGKVISTRTF